MRSWAAVAQANSPRPPPTTHHAQVEAPRPTTSEAKPFAELLLLEAAKSRADVTGERRCLGCGRAFRDMQRFTQHLKDAHGGLNSSIHAPPAWQAGPSLRDSVQLGDVLLRSLPAKRAQQQRANQGHKGAGASQATGPCQQEGRQQSQRSMRRPDASPATAAARVSQPWVSGSGAGSKAMPLLTPPPGTRAKRPKRESRLKRAFRRSAAAQACSRWQGVLAELEAALQAVGEAQGCLENQLAGVLLRLSEAGQAQLQAEAAAGEAAQGAGTTGENQQQEQSLLVSVANLSVQQQLLRQQLQHGCQCALRLQRAHGQAREQLAAAQHQQQKVEQLLVQAEPDALAVASQPGDLLVAAEAPSSHQGAAADFRPPHTVPLQLEALEPAGNEQSAASRQGAVGNAASPAPSSKPASGVAGIERPSFEAGLEARSEAAAASSPSTASSASFGFQDVLSSWAPPSSKHTHTSGHHASPAPAGAAAPPAPAPAPAPLPANASTRQRVGSKAAAMSSGADKDLASLALSGQRESSQPQGTAIAGARPVPAPEAVAGSPEAAAAADSSRRSSPPACGHSGRSPGPAASVEQAGVSSCRSSDTGSSDGSSSGGEESSSGASGSFELQWGDQLLNWASSVRVEAAAVAQHATLAPPAQQPQQMPQQQAGQVQVQAALVQRQQPLDQEQGQVQQEEVEQAPEVANTGMGQQRAASCASHTLSYPLVLAHAPEVSAWLSSAEAAASLPAPEDPSPPGSTATPAAPAGGATAAACGGTVRGHEPPPQCSQLQSALSQSEFVVQAGTDAAGVFRCLLCQVEVSGHRNLLEHLGSKRHAKRLAARAAATAADAVGPEAAQGLGLLHSAAAGSLPGDTSNGAAAGGGSGVDGAGSTSRTYMGPNADVAPYVCQIITPQLNATAEALLRQLLEWQERTRHTDPANFKRKRRLVSGLREVEKAIKVRKAKVVLLAPNISSLAGEEGDAAAGGGGGGVQCPAAALVALAQERGVPLVFALSRQKMGKLLGQRKRASAFAVLDANGMFEELRRLLLLGEEGRQAWQGSAQGHISGQET